MRPSKIATALFACLALGAIGANGALAAGWTIGTTENQISGGTLIVATKESITCRRHGTTPLLFTSTLFGLPVELSAEGVDCLEASIDNTTAKGHGEGRLTLTGVKVLKPSLECTVNSTGGASGEITTEVFTDEVVKDPTAGSAVVFDRFFPEAGGGAFTTLEFGGAGCPLAGSSAAVKGSACGESVHTNGAGTGFEPNKQGH